jgi:hypothetical protein
MIKLVRDLRQVDGFHELTNNEEVNVEKEQKFGLVLLFYGV